MQVFEPRRLFPLGSVIVLLLAGTAAHGQTSQRTPAFALSAELSGALDPDAAGEADPAVQAVVARHPAEVCFLLADGWLPPDVPVDEEECQVVARGEDAGGVREAFFTIMQFRTVQGSGLAGRLVEASTAILLERAQVTLVEQFFERFREDLSASVATRLFPRTSRLLDYHPGPARSLLGPALEASVERDLGDFLPNTVSWIEETALEREDPALDVRVLVLSAHVAERLFEGEDPLKVVQEIPKSIRERTGAMRNLGFSRDEIAFRETMNLLTVVAGEMRSADGSGGWVHPDSIAYLDDTRRRILTGLLMQRMPLQLTTPVRPVHDQPDGYPAFVFALEDLLVDLQRLESARGAFEEVESGEREGDTGEATARYIASFIDVLLEVERLRLFHATDPAGESPLIRSLSSARAVAGFYEAVLREDFAVAVLETIDLVQALGPPEAFDQMRPALRWSSLLVGLAAADSDEQVRGVLEASLLPESSWRAKRTEMSWSATVNGYVGVNGGLERLAGGDGSWSSYVGAGIPVGLEIGRSFSGWEGAYGGALLALADLGVLLSYRLDDEEAETNPEVGLEQIFSPGLYGILGLPGVPLSLSMGLQYAPDLREPRGEESLVRDGSVWRVSFMVGIDIPLFQLGGAPRSGEAP